MKKLLVSFVTAQLMTGAMTTNVLAYDNPARDAAMNMMRQKDYDGALNKLDEAVGFNATDPENFMLRGKCFFVMRNYQLAIEDFNHVINLSPNFYRAFLWRGTAQARLGADQLAVSDYSQAIQLHPQLASSFFSAKGGASSLPGHGTGASGPAIEDYKRAMGQAGFAAGSAPPAGADDTDEFSDFSDASGYRGL